MDSGLNWSGTNDSSFGQTSMKCLHVNDNNDYFVAVCRWWCPQIHRRRTLVATMQLQDWPVRGSRMLVRAPTAICSLQH